MRRESRGGWRSRSEIENRKNSGSKTSPKDPTTLTFFLTDAYTDAAMEELGHERRTRGQERRDGL